MFSIKNPVHALCAGLILALAGYVTWTSFTASLEFHSAWPPVVALVMALIFLRLGTARREQLFAIALGRVLPPAELWVVRETISEATALMTGIAMVALIFPSALTVASYEWLFICYLSYLFVINAVFYLIRMVCNN